MDYLMATYRWEDDEGNDLELEEWCINSTFLPYFTERVSQSTKAQGSVTVVSPVGGVDPGQC
jgi:hypothetical protein